MRLAFPSVSPPCTARRPPRRTMTPRNLSAAAAAGARAIALNELRIRAAEPCKQQGDCAACTSWGEPVRASRQPEAAVRHTHTCAWCSADASCVPRREHGMRRGECSGLLVR
eukprot:4172648-Prymnesium_polylepis.1